MAGNTWMKVGGVDLSDEQYGVIVTRANVSIRPAVEFRSVNLPGARGGVGRAGFYRPANRSVEVLISGSSAADLYQKVDNINALMFDSRGEVEIELGYRAGRAFRGALTGAISAPLLGTSAIIVNMEFECVDPLWYGVDTQETEETINASPFSFDVPESGEVTGNVPTLPVVLLDITTPGGPSHTVTIASPSVGAVFEFERAVADSLWRIDAARMVLESSSDDGANWTPRMNAISAAANMFPALAARDQNEITITGITAGTVTVRYRERYA